jgi:hypothetical protein
MRKSWTEYVALLGREVKCIPSFDGKSEEKDWKNYTGLH